MDVLIKILQYLGHHLAGRGGIGLDVGEHCAFNHLAALPVVVKDHDGLCLFQQFRAFRDTGLIDIEILGRKVYLVCQEKE